LIEWEEYTIPHSGVEEYKGKGFEVEGFSGKGVKRNES